MARMTAYEHGRNAALRGCYRLLANPKDDDEESKWLAGWDSVAAEDRGTLPVTNELRIVRAAIRDDHGGIHSVPIPGRHHDIIKQMREAGYIGSVQGDRQGFLLSDGRFVMREAAGAIARKNGQLKNGTQISRTLTSEDMW